MMSGSVMKCTDVCIDMVVCDELLGASDPMCVKRDTPVSDGTHVNQGLQ